MEVLEKQFLGKGEVSGYKFTQLHETIKGYLYEISDLEGNKHYEAFEKRQQQESIRLMFGKEIHYKAKELYPNSTAFGDWAWCCKNYQSALKRLSEMQL